MLPVRISVERQTGHGFRSLISPFYSLGLSLSIQIGHLGDLLDGIAQIAKTSQVLVLSSDQPQISDDLSIARIRAEYRLITPHPDTPAVG